MYLIVHDRLIVIGCSPGVEAFSLLLDGPGIIQYVFAINPHIEVLVLSETQEDRITDCGAPPNPLPPTLGFRVRRLWLSSQAVSPGWSLGKV